MAMATVQLLKHCAANMKLKGLNVPALWHRVKMAKKMLLSCKIFEHFALQVDPVIEFIQLRSTPFKDSTILVPKLADPPFQWKSNSTPSKSGSGYPIRIDSYVVLFIDVCYSK